MYEIVTLMLPILLLIGLGLFAVKMKMITPGHIEGLAAFVLNFALPAVLLSALARQDISKSFNLGYVLAYGAGSLVTFFIAMAVLRLWLRRPMDRATMGAFGASMSNSGFIAFPVTSIVFGEIALLAIPLFHVTGLHAVCLSTFRAQRKLVTMYRWNPQAAAELIVREQISQINAPSAVTADLLDYARRHRIELPSLRIVGGGGAARAPEQVLAIPQVFPAALPVTGWGMTETNAIGAGIRGRDYLEHPGSVGHASAVLDLRVRNDGDDPDAPGELLVRGASVMRGYWGRPDADAEAFDGEWLRTGDIARIDADGYVWIVDRLKDLIIRGGENIACAAVEAALLEHPAILEAAVFAVPDERLGETVGAALYADAPLRAEDIRRFLEGRLARFQIPERLWAHDGPLPRTASGKLFKHGVRDAVLGGSPAYRSLDPPGSEAAAPLAGMAIARGPAGPSREGATTCP